MSYGSSNSCFYDEFWIDRVSVPLFDFLVSWVITSEDRTKHEATFQSLNPSSGFLTGKLKFPSIWLKSKISGLCHNMIRDSDVKVDVDLYGSQDVWLNWLYLLRMSAYISWDICILWTCSVQFKWHSMNWTGNKRKQEIQ